MEKHLGQSVAAHRSYREGEGCHWAHGSKTHSPEKNLAWRRIQLAVHKVAQAKHGQLNQYKMNRCIRHLQYHSTLNQTYMILSPKAHASRRTPTDSQCPKTHQQPKTHIHTGKGSQPASQSHQTVLEIPNQIDSTSTQMICGGCA